MRREEWTHERIELVRKRAGEGASAGEVAQELGLGPDSVPRLYALSRRQGFRFQRRGRRPDDGRLLIDLGSLAQLNAEARRLRIERVVLAAQLLTAVLASGSVLIDNLLDGEA